jgi:hypothetical protein
MDHCHRNYANHRKIILPLPAGEGWGGGESFELEFRALHGEVRVREKGESFSLAAS